jgi:hypothetical protein
VNFPGGCFFTRKSTSDIERAIVKAQDMLSRIAPRAQIFTALTFRAPARRRKNLSDALNQRFLIARRYYKATIDMLPNGTQSSKHLACQVPTTCIGSYGRQYTDREDFWKHNNSSFLAAATVTFTQVVGARLLECDW